MRGYIAQYLGDGLLVYFGYPQARNDDAQRVASNSVVISASTHRLLWGLFACQELGPYSLKGVATPMSVFRVMRESDTPGRFDVAATRGLTPLVG